MLEFNWKLYSTGKYDVVCREIGWRVVQIERMKHPDLKANIVAVITDSNGENAQIETFYPDGKFFNDKRQAVI